MRVSGKIRDYSIPERVPRGRAVTERIFQELRLIFSFFFGVANQCSRIFSIFQILLKTIFKNIMHFWKWIRVTILLNDELSPHTFNSLFYTL